MSKVHQKVEFVANILIIIVAIALGGVLVQKYFFAAPNSRPERVQPVVGAKMEILDVGWSQQPKTLILALQTGCHFCNESAPFYQRVIETVKGKNIRLVAVFPTDAEKGKAHLNKLGLTDIEVRSSSLDSLQVSGTPTLILTDEKGEITDYWVGKLSADKEDEVISKL